MANKNKQTQPLIRNEEERKKIREATMALVEKEHGIGSCRIMGDSKPVPIPRFRTGSYGIDEITGGGYAKGRIVEIYGPESSGKTTVALHAVAEVQKEGLDAVYIDAEHALDLNYAEALGVDVQNLIMSQPDTGEEALQIAEKWIKSGVVGMVVVDSVASLVPRAELEGDIGDNHVGLLARLMSQALRKLAGLCLKTGVTIIFINQIREKVGVMFGNPETTPGGRALKFYASIRLEVRPSEIGKRDGEAVSRKAKIKAVKNKVGSPHRQVEVDIEFGTGISKAGELLDIGSELGLVRKSGAWYNYGELRLGQGRENAKQYLNENQELLEEIDNALRDMIYPSFTEEELREMDETLKALNEQEARLIGEE
jgi:recombination protein RecA